MFIFEQQRLRHALVTGRAILLLRNAIRTPPMWRRTLGTTIVAIAAHLQIFGGDPREAKL
jgi:hypothetical protein